MRDQLIRGGTLVTAAGRRHADLLCHDGRIAAIGAGLAADGAEVIDAVGCLVMPGGIDPHTHMQLPMMGAVVADDFYSGTAAAAARSLRPTCSAASASSRMQRHPRKTTT